MFGRKSRELTRDEVSGRRACLLMGAFFGLFMYGLMKYFSVSDGDHVGSSLLFTNTTHWPSFVRSFIPLDILVGCIGVWGFSRYLYWVLSHVGTAEKADPGGPFNIWLVPIGIIPVVIGMGTASFTASKGWLFAPIDSAVMSVAICLFLCVFIGLIEGFDRLLGAAGKKIAIAWQARREDHADGNIARFSSWINARDISVPTETADTNPPNPE